MPNYAPYVIILLDSILLSIISQQLWFRYRVYRKYSHIELVREQVVHKRKDIYRTVICALICLKTTHSFCWLLYQGFGDYDLSQHIRLWFFWVFYGVILSTAVLLKGDFASVVVAIEQNIAKNGRKKALWRGLLMGTAVLTFIITMWGIVLSINITNTPIWQYMGFSTSVLNGFITYKMLSSIITTTRETQESTYHVRASITAREFEKQIFTLFHMKQMAVALGLVGLDAIYEFIVNLYHIITRDLILQPFIGNDAWYLYTKLIIFNLYIYSMAMIFLMYTWISYAAIREAAIKSRRVGHSAATPDNHENDVVILPDTLEIAYPPNIDPNDPDNQYNATSDTEDVYPNGSRRNSYNPLHPPLHPTEAMALDHLNINAHPLSPTSSLPVSPPSKLSVLSSTTTVMSRKQSEANEDFDTIDVIPLFGHKISIRHRAASSIATDINVEGFIQESHKDRPHTTMFDMDISSMVRKGCSLERVYFDAQRYRGITPKSLKLTARMRSISYSNHITRYHSRRNTNANNGIYTPSQSNNMLRHKSAPNIGSTNDVEEETSVDSLVFGDKYSNSTDIENSKSTKYQLRNPNVEPLNVHHTVNITLPEDAVLTPDKDVGIPIEIKMKEPQQPLDDFVIVNEDNSIDSNVSLHSNEEESDVIGNQTIPDPLGFSKVQIYSYSGKNETK